MRIIYLPNLYIENNAVMTVFSILFENIGLYDRFELYDMYRLKERETKGEFSSWYYDPMERMEIIKNKILRPYSPNKYLEDYAKWLEVHRPLFREGIVKFVHVPPSAPADNLRKYYNKALEIKGLNDKRDKDLIVNEHIEYIKLDNFYWSLVSSVRHGTTPVTDSTVSYPIPTKKEAICAHNLCDDKTGTKVDNVATTILTNMILSVFPEFPPLVPYEICKIRDALAPEREDTIDALRELTTKISDIINSNLAPEINEASRYLVKSRLMPSFNRLKKAAIAKGNHSFKDRIAKLIDPVTVMLKIFDPTETASKWDVIKEAVKFKLNASSLDNTINCQTPEDVTAMYFFKLSNKVRSMRPGCFQ